MTVELDGNYLLWGFGSTNFRTTSDGGNKVRAYNPSYYGSSTGFPLVPEPAYPATVPQMTQMKFGGTFMGMIFHIDLNQLSPSFSEAVTFEFIKTTTNGTVIVNTGVKVIVPGGEVGAFYSNTDISEFTRTWDSFEFISIVETKEAGTPSSNGTGPGTLMMVLDLDIP
jgi:hypothetical protein